MCVFVWEKKGLAIFKREKGKGNEKGRALEGMGPATKYHRDDMCAIDGKMGLSKSVMCAKTV